MVTSPGRTLIHYLDKNPAKGIHLVLAQGPDPFFAFRQREGRVLNQFAGALKVNNPESWIAFG